MVWVVALDTVFILLVRAIFVLFVCLVLMCSSNFLCLFLEGLNKPLNLQKAVISDRKVVVAQLCLPSRAFTTALRGIPTSCSLEFASEFYASSFLPFPPNLAYLVGILTGYNESLATWNHSAGTAGQAKNVELTANVTQLMEARNTQNTCG